MSGAQAQATTIAQAARRLHEEARGHMRLSNQHRRRARTLYAELEKFKNDLAELGITLDISDIQSPQEGQGGNSNEGPPAAEGS